MKNLLDCQCCENATSLMYKKRRLNTPAAPLYSYCSIPYFMAGCRRLNTFGRAPFAERRPAKSITPVIRRRTIQCDDFGCRMVGNARIVNKSKISCLFIVYCVGI